MSESEFLGQRTDEKVLQVFRKSQLVTRKGYLVLGAAIAVGLVPVLLFKAGWTGWFCFLAILAGLVYLLYKYILWYYTVFVLTNQRLRVVQQRGFFKRRTTDLELKTVVSVSVDTPNLFGVIFKYGTLLVQASIGDMTIFYIKNPEKVCSLIQNAVSEIGGQKSAPKKPTKKVSESNHRNDDEPHGEIIFDDDERIII